MRGAGRDGAARRLGARARRGDGARDWRCSTRPGTCTTRRRPRSSPRARSSARSAASCCRHWDEVERLVNKPNELPWVRLFDGALATEDDALPALAVLRDRRRLRAVARLLAQLHAAAGDRRARARAPTTSPRSCGRCTAGSARSGSSSSRARSTTTCRRARRASRWRCARCTSSGARCPALADGGRRGRRRLGLPAHQRAARAALPQPARLAGRDRRAECAEALAGGDAGRVQRPAPGAPAAAAGAGAPARSCARRPASRPGWSPASSRRSSRPRPASITTSP